VVIINPQIKKQLKDLGKIPYNSIKNASAVIVDMPIGQMKSHDLGRALVRCDKRFYGTNTQTTNHC
tara:strand:+ start:257 stop:454 length:198 start_codon:yes stop_codon:yes gene_type:complete